MHVRQKAYLGLRAIDKLDFSISFFSCHNLDLIFTTALRTQKDFEMRSLLLTAALAGLSMANPVPQDIDLDMVIAAPDPTFTESVGATAQVVTYDTATIIAAATSVTSVTVDTVAPASTDAAAGLAKRGNCAAQPAGATGAPTVTADTPSAFVSNTRFASVASAAATPSGYDQTFVNLNASNRYARNDGLIHNS